MSSILPTVSSSAAWAYISPVRLDLATLRPVITPAIWISSAVLFAAAAVEDGGLGLHLAGGDGVDDFEVAEFFAVLVEGVAGDEEAQDLFFVLEAEVFVPVGYGGESFFGAGGVGGAGSSNMPKRPCWPEAASFWDFWARSMALSRAAKTRARGPKESSAPALQRDSRTRLFMRRRSILSQNS